MRSRLLPIAALVLATATGCSSQVNQVPGPTTGSASGSAAGSTSGASAGLSGAGSGSTQSGTATGSAVGSGTSSGVTAPSSGATSGISTGSSGTSSGANSGTSVAGSSGSASSGSPDGGVSSGSSTSGTAAGGDAGHVMPSAGCGVMATQALMTYVKYNTTVTLAPKWSAAWKSRDYYVWLPGGYDPNRAYPTVFLGPGCGSTGMQVVPVQNASGNNAIIIGLDPDPPAEGRQCFNTEAPDSPEVPYFDQTLMEVEAKFCVDTSRIFYGGFSSGAWLANLLGCVRSGVIRAQASAAGQPPPEPMCNTAPIAAMYVHDVGDPANSYTANEKARDRILALNGCSMQTLPYNPGIAPGNTDLLGHPVQCVEYQGCKAGYPVVWCPTMGLGHNDQVGTGLSSIGWWHFWSSLP